MMPPWINYITMLVNYGSKTIFFPKRVRPVDPGRSLIPSAPDRALENNANF